MPLLYDPQTSLISYLGRPAGEYKVIERVARVSLSFSCLCTQEELIDVLKGLQEGLSHLKKKHPKHSTICFNVKTALEHTENVEGSDQHYEGGRLIFSIVYECHPDEWIVPLSYLHGALNRLVAHKPQNPIVVQTIETNECDIWDTVETAILYLVEKQLKLGGYKWDFHKNDADQWPSDLHGHEYEKNLRLDAYTGYIYDNATRQHWKTLKPLRLKEIQNKLRESPDFAAKLAN